MLKMYMLGKAGQPTRKIHSISTIHDSETDKKTGINFSFACGQGIYKGYQIGIKEIDLINKKVICDFRCVPCKDIAIKIYPPALKEHINDLKKAGCKVIK